MRRLGKALPIAAVVLLLSPIALGGRDDVVLDLNGLIAARPGQVQLLFENPYVWVTSVTLKPGESLPMHETGKRIVYPLTYSELLYVPNYEPEQVAENEGAVHWHPNEAHALVNRGKTAVRRVAVIRKPYPLPKPGVQVCCEVVEKTPFNARIIFENNEARVIEIRLQRGESQPVHFASNRVIYSLSSYRLRMGDEVHRYDPGSVDWSGPSEHSVENVGESEARYIVFELKR